MKEDKINRDYLTAKQPERFVNNKRIQNLIEQGLQRYFVTVYAGPGFGKTEMVREFAKNYQGRLIWLSLTRLDNGQSVFWDNFIRSLRWEVPELVEKLENMSFPLTLAEFTAFYRIFAKELYSGEKILFVIDNYYYVNAPAIKRFFEYFAYAEMENICVMILDHKKPEIAFSKGSVFAITSSELSFTQEETAMFFKERKLNISKDVLEEFYERTNGWPLAIALVASHFEKTENAITGTRPLEEIDFNDIFDLFEEDFFKKYSNQMQDFLVKASLVNQFSKELILSAGNYDYQEISRLISTNSFIIFDKRNNIYTLHTAYRDFLSSKQERLDKEEIKHFFSLVADYYYGEENWIKAIKYYREAGMYDKVEDAMRIQIITQPEKNMQRKILHTYFFIEQFQLIPREIIEKNYLFRIIEASVYYVTLMFDKVEELCSSFEKDLKADNTPRGKIYLGELYLLMAETCIMKQSLGFLHYYKKGAELLPNGSKVKNKTFFAVGNNSFFFLLNRYDEKAKRYVPSAQPGELKKIEEEFFEAQPYMKKAQKGFTAGLAYLYSAEGAYYTGDYSKATKMAYKAIYEALDEEQHDIYCNAYYVHAKVALAHGNLEKLQSSVDEIIHYIDSHKLINLYEMRDCISSWFATTVEVPEDNVPWVKEGRFYDRKIFPIYLGRDMYIHAYYLLHTEQYEQLLSFSDYFKELVIKYGVWLGQICAYIFKAICYHKLGEDENALKSFEEAYHMAYHNNTIMPFVECGSSIRNLLKLVMDSDIKTIDMKWVSALNSKTLTFSKRKSSIAKEYSLKNQLNSKREAVKLSKREKETLQCLAQGLTREEIGEFYNISTSTVKKHITNVYNKLGAINRADAVYIATTEKLL